MAVAFDAVASATGFTSTTPSTTPWLTWTHTAGAGGSVAVVGLAWGSTSFPPTITSITYNGNAMSALGSIATANTSGNGGVLLYGITGQSSGANTVLVKTSGNPSNVMIGNSISFTGAAGFGAAVTNFGTSASASVTVTGTTSGNMVVSVEAHGTNGAVTYTSGTKRFDDEVSAATGASNLSGGTIAAGGSVSLTDTITSDAWGVVGVEVQAPASPPPPVIPALPGRTWLRQFRHPQQALAAMAPPPVLGPAGNQPGGKVVYRRPARSAWGGVLAQPGQPLINGTAQPHLVVARRSPARAVWRGTVSSTVNATPGQAVNGTAPLHLTIARRSAARAVWRGLGVPPRTTAAVTGRGSVARRSPARAVWGGQSTPQPHLPGTIQPRAAVQVPRRIAARAVWRSVLGALNASGPSGTVQPRVTVPVPRRAATRILWRSGTGPANAHGPSGTVQPRPEVGRRAAARAAWRGTPAGTSNAAPSPPVNGTVPPHLTVARRTAARAVWRGLGAAPRLAGAATGGLVRRRNTGRAVWAGTTVRTVNAAPSAPAGQQPHGFASSRRPVGGLWGGAYTPQANASGPSGTVPPHLVVARRAAARAVWRGTPAGGVNSAAPQGPAGTVQPAATVPHRPHAAQRVVWRGLGVPGIQPEPATGGTVKRRPPARGQWHGNTGPGNGHPPAGSQPGGLVRRRTPARGQWHGGSGPANAHGPSGSPPGSGLVRRRTSARGQWRFIHASAVPARQGTVTVTSKLANTAALTITQAGSASATSQLANTVQIVNDI